MADEDDIDTIDSEDQLEWESNGGCAICDSLDGQIFHEHTPVPHPNCDCTVKNLTSPSVQCDESNVQYEVEHSTARHHGSYNPDDEFDLVFDYRITCWGGTGTIEGQVLVSVTYGDWQAQDLEDAFDDAYAEALEEVEEIALAECPACADPPLVS